MTFWMAGNLSKIPAIPVEKPEVKKPQIPHSYYEGEHLAEDTYAFAENGLPVPNTLGSN